MIYKVQPTLPIKYILGVHQFMSVYPTIQDFMFDVITYLVKTSEKKGVDLNNLRFSVKTLNYVFGDNMKSDEFVERIKSILKTLLLESETLEKKGEFIHIDKSELSKYYEIIDHGN